MSERFNPHSYNPGMLATISLNYKSVFNPYAWKTNSKLSLTKIGSNPQERETDMNKCYQMKRTKSKINWTIFATMFGCPVNRTFERANPTLLKKLIIWFQWFRGSKLWPNNTVNTKFCVNFFPGAHINHPPKNALYHTVQMVLVDPCDKLIICFLWLLKGGKHNYILLLHQ